MQVSKVASDDTWATMDGRMRLKLVVSNRTAPKRFANKRINFLVLALCEKANARIIGFPAPVVM